MSEQARAIIEAVSRPWSEFTDYDRQALAAWLQGARAEDLYLLLRYARQQWRRPRRSSSQTMHAIAETAAPVELEEPVLVDVDVDVDVEERPDIFKSRDPETLAKIPGPSVEDFRADDALHGRYRPPPPKPRGGQGNESGG